MQCLFHFHFNLKHDSKTKESVSVSHLTFRVPAVEDILETIIYKDPPIEVCMRKIEQESLIIADEVIPNLSGTISYVSFTQSMMRNKHLLS